MHRCYTGSVSITDADRGNITDTDYGGITDADDSGIITITIADTDDGGITHADNTARNVYHFVHESDGQCSGYGWRWQRL